MSPSEQERCCADAILSHLCRNTQREWGVDAWLDDLHPNEPSPDVLLTDGGEELAVDIKQVTDGEVFHDHVNSLRSLDRRLALDTARNYVVTQQPFLPLPRHYQWIRRAKIRNAAAALEISVGGTAIVPIRRRTTVRLLDQSEHRLVVCQHQWCDEMSSVSAWSMVASCSRTRESPSTSF